MVYEGSFLRYYINRVLKSMERRVIMKVQVVRTGEGTIMVLTDYGRLDMSHTQYKKEFGCRVKKNTRETKELKLFNIPG